MSSTTSHARPIIISGPSGVGKGTLIDKLRVARPDKIATTVSHTTRKPRPGETEGVDYFFKSPPEFASLIDAGAFIEHTYFDGNHYGTSKQTIADQMCSGLTVILDIEMEGVKSIKTSSNLEARYIFIKPPSLSALEARLRRRGTEDEANIQKRLARARAELEYAATPGVHDLIIVNDDLERAYTELEEFVFGEVA
ncbi:hypothetical protein NM208_g6846 [Fusarium decemcellulare]|uniref:Uncharacterized protein n=1 Tax=Fusarium decemcellulare TaxID=57161 RepID=A0ACC1SBL3_9HYPO|nr:hypothetical protein NM208_g6846 [Fusarium decemcellulare]